MMLLFNFRLVPLDSSLFAAGPSGLRFFLIALLVDGSSNIDVYATAVFPNHENIQPDNLLLASWMNLDAFAVTS